MIHKYTEDRNLLPAGTLSFSLKSCIYRNNIHSSLKINKLKKPPLPNPSPDHHILSTWSSKIQLKSCYLCIKLLALYVPNAFRILLCIIVTYYNYFSVSSFLPSSKSRSYLKIFRISCAITGLNIVPDN